MEKKSIGKAGRGPLKIQELLKTYGPLEAAQILEEEAAPPVEKKKEEKQPAFKRSLRVLDKAFIDDGVLRHFIYAGCLAEIRAAIQESILRREKQIAVLRDLEKSITKGDCRQWIGQGYVLDVAESSEKRTPEAAVGVSGAD